MTIYLASWTQSAYAEMHSDGYFTGRQVPEHRLTQHVDEAQFTALREHPMILDLRGIPVGGEQLPDLTSELALDDLRWLQGGRRQSSTELRCGRTQLEELAADVVRLESDDLGPVDPVERRQVFGEYLALFALATAGQPDSPLERARELAAKAPMIELGQ